MTTITGFEGIEYTAPYPGVQRMPAWQLRPGEHYQAVHRLAARTFDDWDAVASGCAVPYNRVLPDGRGGREFFLPHAFKEDHGREVALLIDHDAVLHVGWARLEDQADGLYLTDGQIRRGGMEVIGHRRALSLGFNTLVRLAMRGIVRRYACRVVEVSICERGVHSPHSHISICGRDTLPVAA